MTMRVMDGVNGAVFGVVQAYVGDEEEKQLKRNYAICRWAQRQFEGIEDSEQL